MSGFNAVNGKKSLQLRDSGSVGISVSSFNAVNGKKSLQLPSDVDRAKYVSFNAVNGKKSLQR